jgi:hypothetical protein
MSLLVSIWAVGVAALFFGSFSWARAASDEPFGRYIYVAVLAACIVGAALSLMRSHGRREQ